MGIFGRYNKDIEVSSVTIAVIGVGLVLVTGCSTMIFGTGYHSNIKDSQYKVIERSIKGHSSVNIFVSLTYRNRIDILILSG